jgi:hypothetical protein
LTDAGYTAIIDNNTHTLTVITDLLTLKLPNSYFTGDLLHNIHLEYTVNQDAIAAGTIKVGDRLIQSTTFDGQIDGQQVHIVDSIGDFSASTITLENKKATIGLTFNGLAYRDQQVVRNQSQELFNINEKRTLNYQATSDFEQTANFNYDNTSMAITGLAIGTMDSFANILSQETVTITLKSGLVKTYQLSIDSPSIAVTDIDGSDPVMSIVTTASTDQSYASSGVSLSVVGYYTNIDLTKRGTVTMS